MHHRILVKIKADDAELAMASAKSELESSVDADNNTAGWDYVSDDPILVTREVLKKEGHASYKMLWSDWADETDVEIANHKESLKDIFFKELLKRHLSGRDALAYQNYKNQYGNTDEEIKAIVEKAVKNGKPRLPMPVSLEDIAAEMVEIVDPLGFDKRMVDFHIRKIYQLYQCKKYPKDTAYTLQCTDHHVADLGFGRPCKGTAFYIIFDRHF